MKNAELSRAFNEFAFLTEVEGGDNSTFKARAYYRAAETIAGLSVAIEDVYRESGLDGLIEIPSIGKAIASKIEEYIKKGRIAALDELKSRIPINVAELSAIEGVGPKTIKTLYDSLGIKNLADLEKAATQKRLRKLPGVGEKKEQEILRQIPFLRAGRGRRLIAEVYPLTKEIESKLLAVRGVSRAMAAGSIRRMKETIGDIDFLVASTDPERVMEFFVKMPQVEEVISRGPAKAFVRLAGGVEADLLVVPEESWGSALQYFTGSKEHSVELRRIAIARGIRLNEWGVFREEERIAGKTEEEVYSALGLAWIPPEMRENRGEIELARHDRLPSLIGYDSLKGDLQVHTSRTDGRATAAEMARAAKEFGLEYIAITDHTKSLAMTGGLDDSELLGEAEEIWALNDELEGIRVLASAEVNILKDGSLDIANNTLDRLDVVGAAIHSHFSLPEETQTMRLTKAAKNPSVDIIFHPTGRLINKRDGYPVNMSRLIDVAADTKTVLEIDAHYDRLDLRDDHVRQALSKGVRLMIDSDAHHPIHFAFLKFGIAQARRGWARKEDVLNTFSAENMLKSLK